jgi:2-octaprenyl-6-methoxyphenol hydroxylase
MYDVAVVGGGFAGATLSLLLAGKGVSVALIEREKPDRLTAVEADGRTTALSASARTFMKEIGVWEALEDNAEPIWDIRVADRASHLSLHFDHREIGGEPMGHIVENFRLRRVLLDAVRPDPHVSSYWGTTVQGFDGRSDRAELRLNDHQIVEAQLAIAADGRGSAMRRFAKIGLRSTDYGQTAIVCTVHHQRRHGGIAHERFLAGGPFAILPMTDERGGAHRSSIVWTERRSLAEHLSRQPRDILERELARRLGSFLGQVAIEGDIWTFPLSLTVASRLTGPRLALLGEAGHGIHPIAGQGFNVSVRDIATLGDLVGSALQAGRDLGASDLLARYARRRWPDILAMVAATDGLNRLFLTSLPPVALGRRLGLAAVHRLPGVKRQFQRHAMGLGLFADRP